MGQYHYTVNLDKHEFIDPYKLGDGLKLVEQTGYLPGGTNDALHLLLACSSGRGGGDFPEEADPKHEWIGRWAGDRIAVVGDYAEDSDLAAKHKAKSIYARCRPQDFKCKLKPHFKDITDKLVPVMMVAYEVVYWGGGWRNRGQLYDVIDYGALRFEYTHSRGERLASIDGKNYRVADMIEALEVCKNRGRDEKPKFVDLKLKPVT